VEHGQRYRLHFQGAVLIEDCWNPELDACRALVVRGLAGRLEVWRAGQAYPGIIIPILAPQHSARSRRARKWALDLVHGRRILRITARMRFPVHLYSRQWPFRRPVGRSFPDEDGRPAKHALSSATDLPVLVALDELVTV
jgi:hypothetical protein